MSMRSQFYLWDNFTSNTTTATIAAGTRFSIFIGGVGRTQTLTPPETTATQFVVIEQFGCTPTVGDGSLQVLINTTQYFLNPDGLANIGVPGLASPYPITTDHYPSYNLVPIYILPGQVWDMDYTIVSGVTGGPEGAGTVNGDLIVPDNIVQAFVQYTLYDGPDALVANKLLEMGLTVKPANIDWFKRKLIEGQARAQGQGQGKGQDKGKGKGPEGTGVQYSEGQKPVEVA